MLTVDNNNKINISNISSGFIASSTAPNNVYEGLK
jgi:hypothetical protein